MKKYLLLLLLLVSGCPGGPAGAEAVDLALEEAGRRRLRLLDATGWPQSSGSFGMCDSLGWVGDRMLRHKGPVVD